MASFDFTGWPIPADVDKMLLSANITPGAGVTTEIKQLAIDGAVSEFVNSTGREFKPTAAGTVRYYDGSGTGEMIVDDLIAATDISFFALPSSPVQLVSWTIVENVPFSKNRIIIFQGPVNTPVGYYSKFPIGRRNIQITGTFGTMPIAVWEAVLVKAAGKIANRARMTPQGLLTDFKDLDQDFKWSDQMQSTVSGWDEQFNQIKADFKRPIRDLRARQVPLLI